MIELHRAASKPCSQEQIAVAINPPMRHCGLVYPTSTDAVEMCEVRTDHSLMSQAVPDHYYWTPVQLLDHEVSAIAVLVEMVLKENPRGFPYSLVYSPDALDITGRLRSGAGFTCATYVVALFDTLKIPFLATKTWKARPEEDQAFKDQYLEGNYFDPIRRGMAPFISDAAAARIQFETPDFRVKPGEVCGAATAKNYPVNFTQAVQRAKQVAERIEELQKEATSNLPSNSS